MVRPSQRSFSAPDHLDDAHDVESADGEHGHLGAVPLVARGGPPLGALEQRLLVVAAGRDHLVPALGHRHEHHRRVPVEAHVDGARRELRVHRHAVLGELGGDVDPPLRAVRRRVDVREPGPRDRDAALAAALAEVAQRVHRGRVRAGRAPPRPRRVRRPAARRTARRTRRPRPARDGTGRPDWSTSRNDVERPHAPSSIASRSMAAMAAVSSSVAARVHASGPIATSRSMLCPTRPARLMPVPVAFTTSR